MKGVAMSEIKDKIRGAGWNYKIKVLKYLKNNKTIRNENAIKKNTVHSH
jgi:hypothetical protein